MPDTRSLWSCSPTWRWVLSLTLLATALAALSIFSQPPTPAGTAQATYTSQFSSPSNRIAVSVRQSPRDTAFDIPISLPTATFSSETELHVIGVYEAALPNGEKEKPWWSNCLGLEDDQKAMIACHQKHANQHPIRTITINLNQTTSPVVLALMAYEPTRWKIISRPTVDLRKVIISGYYGQDIEGLDTSIPVDAHSYESSPCLNCSRQPDYFYAYKKEGPEYKKAMSKLTELTGLSPTSFQAAYRSEKFTVSSHNTAHMPRPALSQPEQYTGKTFSNHLTVAQTTLLLPDGQWYGLGHLQLPSTRGEEHYLLLSKTSKNTLTELLAIRLNRAQDHQGFAQYNACNQPADYTKKVHSNQPLGEQLCYWSSYINEPWQQPIFKLAAHRLTELGVVIPDTAISTGFHKADASMSLTTLYHAFPTPLASAQAKKDWSMNPWNPSLISSYPENSQFLDNRLRWAVDWFQIFSATQYTPAPSNVNNN